MAAPSTGNWSADFSTPGDEPDEGETYDIVPGSDGVAEQWDEDLDSTNVDWRVPNPNFWVSPLDDRVQGNEWPEGALVTLTIDDPGIPGPVDYTDSKTVTFDPCCGAMVNFEFQGVFDVQRGHFVTLSDGVTIKTHTVTNLAVTAVDPDTDTVAGTADPGTDVEMGICDQFGCASRYEVADGFGDWAADFSTPGDEPGEETTYDIVPGSQGDTNQVDADGDSTHVHWQASPGPVITSACGLLISDTGGILWTFDVQTGQLIDYQLPIAGNFDIQYIGPERIVIASYESAEIYEFDLSTGDFTLVTDHPSLGTPIGIAVDLSGGTYYIADGESGVLAYDVQTDTMRVVIGPFEGGFDGIALDHDGRILATNGSGRLYRISPDGTFLEVVADVGPYRLNGLVVTPDGQVLVASMDPGAVFSIDPDTRDFSMLYEGPPFRDPEDVAIAPNGDVYISDTDFQQEFPDFVPALYRIPAGTSTLETLYAGEPLGDIVDILITPGPDTDGDCVPDSEQPTPTFTVFMSADFSFTEGIGGFDFLPSSQVTLTVDQGADGSIDYEATETVDANGGAGF